MKVLQCNGRAAAARSGIKHVYYDPETPLSSILETLSQEGALLKTSGKASVRRVNDWVIKESQGKTFARLIRHTFRRNRYRRAWLAAHHLLVNGVAVPKPVAYVESRFAGLVFGNIQISEYLEGYRNVERFLLALVQRGAGRDTVSMFLQDLADAVNRLTGSGAYHADLSGKNILTRDGTEFFFVDLDAVALNVEYTDEMRMKNHVQLYDSFCDLLNDTMLVPFIERMLTEKHNPRVWMPAVRKGQNARRSRFEKTWAGQKQMPEGG